MYRKSGVKRSFVSALAVLLVGFSSATLHAAVKLSISSAVPVYTVSPHQLIMQGSGFGTLQPLVTISTIPALVLSYTDTLVTVQIPSVVDAVPGIYVVTLTANRGNGNATDTGNQD